MLKKCLTFLTLLAYCAAIINKIAVNTTKNTMVLNLKNNAFVKLEKVKLSYDATNKTLSFRAPKVVMEDNSTFELFLRRECPRKKTSTQFPGICADAKKLGVSKTYLWKVLKGYPYYRNSKIIKKYCELLNAKPKHVKAFIEANMEGAQ